MSETNVIESKENDTETNVVYNYNYTEINIEEDS